MLLTPEQITSFKEVGYVVVPNLIEPNTLENWRGQIRSQIGDVFDPKTAGDPEKYRKDITVLRDFRFTPEETHCVNQPKVKTIIDQLGGGQFQGKDGNIRLLYPEPQREWNMPDNGWLHRQTRPTLSPWPRNLPLRRRNPWRWHRLLAWQPHQILAIPPKTPRPPRRHL